MKIKSGDAVILTVNGVIHYYSYPIFAFDTYPKQKGVISLFNMHFDTDGVILDVNRNAIGRGEPAVWQIYNAKDVTNPVVVAHNKQKQLKSMLAKIAEFAENADDFSMIENVYEKIVECESTLKYFRANVSDELCPVYSVREANDDGTFTPIWIYKGIGKKLAGELCETLNNNSAYMQKNKKLVVI